MPSVITGGLRERGVDVWTVQDDRLLGETDPNLLDRATELGRVFFTRDTDFLEEAHRRQREHIEFAGVVYAHQLQVSIGQTIADLELLATACEPEEMMNRVEYLPL
ncbi:MAG: DUF5615 family PIN-like protein [Planctomycetota bacterium]|nr:DUF5615 family PIN-like protein [Planctomycetota bacterium]